MRNNFTNKGAPTEFKYKYDISEYMVFIGLIVLCIVLSVLSPVFLSKENLINVLLQTSVNAIISIGMTIVIITGGIDLSVGSIVGVSGIAIGILFQRMGTIDSLFNGLICIVLGIAIGLLFGLINGILIGVVKLPPFIATLGTMSIARGFALSLSGARPQIKIPTVIKVLGDGQIGPIYIPILIMFVLYIISWWMLKHTILGRSIYAVGGNSEAARLSGIDVNKTIILTYVISGILAGIASVVLLGRIATAQPTAGTGYEMDAIAASVIGGVSMTGGVGKIFGTLIGALLISVIKNGLNLINVSTYIQQIVTGLVIIIAVMFDVLKKRNNN